MEKKKKIGKALRNFGNWRPHFVFCFRFSVSLAALGLSDRLARPGNVKESDVAPVGPAVGQWPARRWPDVPPGDGGVPAPP
eukprot:1064029-Prorocentrum_minimum.AAC.1